MSAEIVGFDHERHSEIRDCVVELTSGIMIETGGSPALAYGPGTRAGVYAAELLLTTLSRMGRGDIDPQEFTAALREVESATLPAGRPRAAHIDEMNRAGSRNI